MEKLTVQFPEAIEMAAQFGYDMERQKKFVQEKCEDFAKIKALLKRYQ